MNYRLAGARGKVTDRDRTLRQAQEWAAARRSEVLLADATVVFGREHLESAVIHATRARDAGTMATRSLSMETLLYLAGERQVADAIRVAGLKDRSEAFAVVVFGDGKVEELLSALGWSPDDRVLEARGKDLAKLGIGPTERSTVTEGKAADLALERTALVDVLK